MRIGILISGRGSNMQALVKACQEPDYPAEVAVVISNRPDALGLEYARHVGEKLHAAELRATVDVRNEKLGAKIREAQLAKVPVMLVVGDREAADGAVAVRQRTAGDQGSMSLDAFIEQARERVAGREE